jgi:hypothetical protein
MVNYLMIQNKGLIYPEDIELIGSSTKRNDSNKIGQFGSGWKFALAWILRNELTIKILSGKDEIVVDFTIKMHRDEPVKILTVNGKETSITSGMGELDWKPWMALREIVSNAIDEGEEKVETLFNPQFKGYDNKTTIYIEMNGELSDILKNFQSYFAFERKAIWEKDDLKIYKKSEVSNTIVFRKGIKCFEGFESCFDFSFPNIKINESRLSDEYEFKTNLKHLVSKIDDVTIFFEIIKVLPLSYYPTNLNNLNLEFMIDLCKVHSFAPKSVNKIVGFANANYHLIPDAWYIKLRDLGLIEDFFENAFGKKSDSGNDFYIMEDLKELSNEVSYHISGRIPNFKLIFVKFIENKSCVFLEDVFYLNEEKKNETHSSIFASCMYALDHLNLQKFYNL